MHSLWKRKEPRRKTTEDALKEIIALKDTDKRKEEDKEDSGLEVPSEPPLESNLHVIGAGDQEPEPEPHSGTENGSVINDL